MNGKTKAAVIIAMVLLVAASTIYVAPALASANGTTDQTRDRERDRLCDKTCNCDCTCDQTQTRTRLQLQECAMNQTCTGPEKWQYQYQNRYKHQNMLSP